LLVATYPASAKSISLKIISFGFYRQTAEKKKRKYWHGLSEGFDRIGSSGLHRRWRSIG